MSEELSRYQSWGRTPRVSQQVYEPSWLHQLSIPAGGTVLPYGQGRSYGDCCLNDGGTIISTRRLDRIIAFDRDSGVARCEAGLTLGQLLSVSVPRGWFLPVSPGTQFVSIGGAIANDVHGKNHHRAGTVGRHILRFELLRSNGERILCSPDSNSALFNATIAGLGLTGLILWAEVQLKPVQGAMIDVESIKFSSLDEFFEISHSSDQSSEYTVAWLDCVSSGASFGRGVFIRGNHAEITEGRDAPLRRAILRAPLDAPAWALNPLTVRAFNAAYYGKQMAKTRRFRSRFEPFFYPLDAVTDWNKIYGKRGFFQFQCVVPQDNDNRAIREILRAIVDSKRASFLAVLKAFGDSASPGLLSFPRPGVTLCLDFPNDGEGTVQLLKNLDDLTAKHGGAIYPAKDAVMSRENFHRYFPRIREFLEFKDPRFSSSLWRRVYDN